MFSVTRVFHFCYGHRLMDYAGKCRHPHGHNGKVEISIRKDRLDALFLDSTLALALAGWISAPARIVEPLAVRLNDSTVYNLPPPTQGLSALMILGLFERLGPFARHDQPFVGIVLVVDFVARLHQEHAAERPAFAFGDPRALEDAHHGVVALVAGVFVDGHGKARGSGRVQG